MPMAISGNPAPKLNINITLVAQAAVFAAFIWFTVRFVWPFLLRAIEERQQKRWAASASPRPI